MKLIVCDPTSARAIEQMRQGGVEVDVKDTVTPEELLEVIPAYDAMVVRSRTKVTAAVIDAGVSGNLKLIIRAGVGVDNIDVAHAKSKGVEVRNTPASPSNSVAELTIGYLLALARQIPQATASMKAGQWEKKAFSKCGEVSGKTLGLVGYGMIGKLVADKAHALGMEVLACDPYVTQYPEYVQAANLDDLCSRADYVSLHVPHTPETHYIIGTKQLEMMKKGVYIVNCGRGGTLDEAALAEAIASGKVAGAALDVFEDEKVERGQRLMQLPQVIGTPHVGSGTVEAEARVGGEVAQIAIDFSRR